MHTDTLGTYHSYLLKCFEVIVQYHILPVKSEYPVYTERQFIQTIQTVTIKSIIF